MARAGAHRGSGRGRGRLLAFVLPVLLVGFAFGAFSARVAFNLWAVAAAAGLAWVLARAAGGGRETLAGLLALAPALVVLGALVERHRDGLETGWRAVWPATHVAAGTAPALYHALAGLAAVVAVAGLAAARKKR